MNGVRTSYRELPEKKVPSNLETHGSYSFRKLTSHNLHKESQSRTHSLTQEASHRQHKEGHEPAMPLFGKDSWRLLPPTNQLGTVYTHLTGDSYRTARLTENTTSGETLPNKQEVRKPKWNAYIIHRLKRLTKTKPLIGWGGRTGGTESHIGKHTPTLWKSHTYTHWVYSNTQTKRLTTITRRHQGHPKRRKTHSQGHSTWYHRRPPAETKDGGERP